MSESKIQSLAEEEAIEQIVETVQQAEEGAAPFALVLGSGFSHGLVPTALELVSESLPLWMKAQTNKSFDSQKAIPADQRSEIARDFWSRFAKRNASRGLALPLDSQTGLPESYSDAYRAVFTPEYIGAVGEPAQARKFQRALTRLDKPRLNAAHFLLASLLGVQPGKSRRSDLFKASAAFSRLILTTNFDPFLQTALQAVNRLYFMSDTPELGVGDEIFDDQTDAIHLVYLHGTIHRRSQAATDDDIKALKEKNARTLAPALKRHGVIVLGYSGWDDAIVEALAACDRFDHRLYWCGRESDPLTKGAFGPRVADILRKPSALYVRTAGAGNFMAQLCIGLVKGLPRLLDNPIAQLREMLETIDLNELKNLGAAYPVTSNTQQLIDIGPTKEAFIQAQNLTLQRLVEAEQVFRGRAVPAATQKEAVTPTLLTPTSTERRDDGEISASSVDPQRQIQQLLSSARVADALGNHVETLRLCKEALDLGPREPADLADLWLVQGRAHYFLGNRDEAILSWSQVVALREAPIAQVAEALVDRGLAWGRNGEVEKALADFTRLIEQLPDAPIKQVAAALINRGVSWGKQGEIENALADYTRVIEELPGTRVEDIAIALRNRGFTWGQKGERGKELADYTHLIEQLPGAPVEQIAMALRNRAVAWGEAGEREKELADYTRLIEQMPGAPVEQVAVALGNRGWVNYERNNFAAFLADTEAALNKLPASDKFAFNLGLALLACGRDTEALQAYKRAGEQFPQSIDSDGLPDLEEAKKKWLGDRRAKPVIQLLHSLKK